MSARSLPDAVGPTQPDPNERLTQALAQLGALHEGYAGVGAVIACGRDAVPGLNALLRHTETSGIFEVRQRAIAALLGLGADDVLIDFISDPQELADPTARAGEQATLSSAARALKASKNPRAVPALLKLAKRQVLPGVIEALSALGREQAVPALIRGLDEDDTRALAAAALVKLGRLSRNALLTVALAEAGSDSDLRRRRVAMAALADIGPAPWQRAEVRQLVDHRDAELSFQAARALFRSGGGADQAHARERLRALAASLRSPLKEEALRLIAPRVESGVDVRATTAAPRSGPRRPILHLNIGAAGSL